MKKFFKMFALMLAIIPALLLFTACGGKEETHVHKFSTDNSDFCVNCESYVVKGEGSEYLEEGQTPKNLEDVWTNAEEKDGEITYIISGKVNFDVEESSSQILDLGKGAGEVHITGEGDNSEITIIGKYYGKFKVGNGENETKLYFENLTINSSRNMSGHNTWEFYHILTHSTEVYFKNCKFTEGVIITEQTKATFDSCEFQVSGTHYSIWLGESGYYDYSTYLDNLKTCVIKNCTFNSNRGIKVLTNGASVTIEGNTFNNLTGKPGIVLDSNNGEMNTVVIKNNTFNECVYGKYNSADNTLYENGKEAYLTDYFTVTEIGSVVND